MKNYTFLEKRIAIAAKETDVDSTSPVCELIRRDIDSEFRGSAKMAILKLCDTIRSETESETEGRNGQPKQ
jgi:hypothetical protein